MVSLSRRYGMEEVSLPSSSVCQRRKRRTSTRRYTKAQQAVHQLGLRHRRREVLAGLPPPHLRLPHRRQHQRLAQEAPEAPVVQKYMVRTRGLGMKVLRLLCKGTGLPPDYFEGDLTNSKWNLDINHYPACPTPSMTLGLPPHYDRFLMTILHPGPVPGLEVAYKGDWIISSRA
ncbi:hypothetical protein ACP70R_032646 [Stipagrostis hirtigluma subsp. patula]